jgi:hypothetical protein
VYKVRLVQKDTRTGKERIDVTYCLRSRLPELGLVKRGKRYVLPTA